MVVRGRRTKLRCSTARARVPRLRRRGVELHLGCRVAAVDRERHPCARSPRRRESRRPATSAKAPARSARVPAPLGASRSETRAGRRRAGAQEGPRDRGRGRRCRSRRYAAAWAKSAAPLETRTRSSGVALEVCRARAGHPPRRGRAAGEAAATGAKRSRPWKVADTGCEAEGRSGSMSTRLDGAAEGVDRRGGSRPLSGPTRTWPSPRRPDGDRAASGRRRPDRRSRGGRRPAAYGSALASTADAVADVVAADAVADVDDRRVGRDARDHGRQTPAKSLLDPVVGEEGDRQRPAGATLDGVPRAPRAASATRPSMSCCVASTRVPSRPELAGGVARDRADRDDPRVRREPLADATRGSSGRSRTR